MKKLITGFIGVSLVLLSSHSFALQFVKKDEKGNYIFRCEMSSDRAISIKIIDKGRYKVLAPYIGRIIHAKSEAEVARMVCGEADKNNIAK
jgi:hypothetical protein